MDCECGCGRPAAPGGRLSWACYKQKKRTGSTVRRHPEKSQYRHETPRDMVMEAARALADADGVGPMWDKAVGRLWMAMLRYRRKRTANRVQKTTETLSRG